MLVLTFKEGEAFRIGDDITICVERKLDRDEYAYSNQVTLAVDAPKYIDVHREELLEENRNLNQGEMS